MALPKPQLPSDPLEEIEIHVGEAWPCNPTDPEECQQLILGLKKEAELGSAAAQFKLARCFELGKYVTLSEEKAIYYYKMACDQGHRAASFALALLYDYGRIHNINSYEKGLHYYQICADRGSKISLQCVGYFYEQGLGVSQSNEKAYECYYKSAEQGYALAWGFLAKCFEEGLGIDQSFEKAECCYKRCAYLSSFDKAGKIDFNKILLEISSFESNGLVQIENQRCSGQEKGFRYFQQAFVLAKALASLGNTAALFKVGLFYENGYGTSKSKANAIRYYLLAAQKGHEEAEQRLNILLEEPLNQQSVVYPDQKVLDYLTGEVELMPNPSECNEITQAGLENEKAGREDIAFKCYEEGARAEDPAALYLVGHCYEKAIGITQDLSLSFHYYVESANRGLAIAQFTVGMIYLIDRFYEEFLNSYNSNEQQRKELADHYLHLAAEQGLLLAQLEMGFWLSEDGPDKSSERAFYYWLLAANNDDAEGLFQVGCAYRFGDGISKSLEKAIEYLNQAIKKKHPSAMHQLGSLFALEKSVKDQKLAFYYLAKSDDYGVSLGGQNPYFLGKLYLAGFAGYSPEIAFHYFNRAYQDKNDYFPIHGAVNFELGRLYEHGLGVEKSFEQALKHYIIGAEWSDSQAAFYAARFYCMGIGVERSVSKAIQYLKIAIKGNHSDPKKLLIECENALQNGTEVDFSWLKKFEKDKVLEVAKDIISFNLGPIAQT